MATHSCVVAAGFFGNVKVSTVFLGLDHDAAAVLAEWFGHEHAGGRPPVLWETMIFRGADDGYVERYRSLAEAMKGHRKALKLVQSPTP